MVRYSFLIVIFAGILFSACVPNRKYVYLQKDDVKKKNIPTDTILRSHIMHIREYRIQPLDLLYVRVESLTSEDFDFINKLDAIPDNSSSGGGANPLRVGFLVDTEGFLEYPILGKVKLSGLTVFEAQNVLKEMFKNYLKLPSVRVRLLNFRFTVLGEVNAEQQVVSLNTRVTFMEAIGLSGGFTDLADRSKIKVVRQRGDSTDVFYLNLLDENFVSSPYYFIQQNDIIVVPPLRQRPLRRYFAQNLAMFTVAITTLVLIVTLTNK